MLGEPSGCRNCPWACHGYKGGVDIEVRKGAWCHNVTRLLEWLVHTTGSVPVQDQSQSVHNMYVSAAWLDTQDDSPSRSSVSISVAESCYTAVTVMPVDYYIYGVLCTSNNYPYLVLLPQRSPQAPSLLSSLLR